MKTFYVYIMSSRNRTLYAGVTNDLDRRVVEHRTAVIGFCAWYNVRRLVWYEAFTDVNEAIAAEKRIKGWKRAKKIALIESTNPRWDDLAQQECPAHVTLRYSEGSPALESQRSFGVPQDDNSRDDTHPATDTQR
ncbi:MAG: GIY-YIG nuclease family protein [Tepidisphaeraceae bacterium]